MSGGRRRLPRVPRAPREQAQRDVDDELAFHLEMRTAELIASGETAARARALAEEEFGDLERARSLLRREAMHREREERRIMVFDELRHDLGYALRNLVQRPGFTVVALVTLGLGIAATTTVFTVFDAVILRPLPVHEPERVVVPHSGERGTDERWNVTYSDFLDWEQREIFAASALMQFTTADLRVGTTPERFSVALVTEEFFSALGADAARGRLLGSVDYAPEAPTAVVLSHEVWQTRFGGAPDIVGRTVGTRVSGVVVGVLEPGDGLPSNVEMWLPLRTTGGVPAWWLERDNYVFGAVARLHDGVTLAQTNARLRDLAAEIEQQIPAERTGVILEATPLRDELLGATLPRAMSVLLIAVGFVLLIGCANVANLLLARGAARRREFAVRTAMGARPLRLARQLLTESLVLGLAGGLLGMLLARWGLDLLLRFAPVDLPRIGEVALNTRVLLVGIAVSIAAALVFGLAPVLQAMRTAPSRAMADSSARSAGGRSAARVRRGLVVAELALSVMLLVGAGLLVRSLLSLQRIDPGFRTENSLTLSLDLPDDRYEADSTQQRFYRDLANRLREVPGVQSVSMASALPLGAGGFYLTRAYLAEGQPEPPVGTEVVGPWTVIAPGYFAAMDVPLLQGRDFDTRDAADGVPVMIVNREFARRMFGDTSPVGQRVRSWRDENVLREIIGVVGDVRYFGVADELRPTVYVPHAQNTWGAMNMIVRTAGDPAAMIAAVRAAIRTMDRDLAVADVQTLADAHRRSIAAPRFNALLLAVFALLALVLASTGIYGVLAYSVSQRTREFGVRMALGARRHDVVRLVLGEGLLLVGAGVSLGLIGALATSRWLERLLYELEPRDPLTFIVVAAALGAVALLASYIPARRATAVAPTTALRQD